MDNFFPYKIKLISYPLTGSLRSLSQVNKGKIAPMSTVSTHPSIASSLSQPVLADLAIQIRQLAKQFGFLDIGIVEPNLEQAGERLNNWLAQGFQADMAYMGEHGSKRWRAQELVPGTARVICLTMPYLDAEVTTKSCLEDAQQGYVARYALGRDYHKLVRKRLAQMAKAIEQLIGPFGYRVFVDSAPVMEKPMAQQAGLGWQGKNTLLINRKSGSWFFLGEIFVDLPLPTDEAYDKDHCSRCTACMDVCPTNAFPEPYVLDANKCIAYLTIEHKGPIPLELRPLMGNRIFGCDDCQLGCPYNRLPATSQEADFSPRHQLDQPSLIQLFNWSAEEFDQRTQGSPIRRAGYDGWLRNIAIAIGNGRPCKASFAALNTKLHTASPMVAEHIQWAIESLNERQNRGIPLLELPLNQLEVKKLTHLK